METAGGIIRYLT